MGTLNARCAELFELLFDHTDSEIVHEYSTSFLRLPSEHFDAVYPLLLSYSKSKVFLQSPGYFCQYVLPFTKKQPAKCVQLITNFDKFVKSDMTRSNYYGEAPMQLVLSIYNGLVIVKKNLK